MAFAVARFWGLLPHVVMGYSFRYFMELRRFYIAATLPIPASANDQTGGDGTEFNWESELFRGDSL